MGSHVGLRLVEVEEDVALGVERRFGRVHVLGDRAAFVVNVGQGSGGEGDGLALLIGDGEGDALAEAGVERAEWARLRHPCPGSAEETAGAKDVFREVRLEALAHVIEVILARSRCGRS